MDHCGEEFQKWLDDTIRRYKSFTDEERNKTMQALVESSSSQQIWYLQQRFQNCDILSLLPQELQEYLLMFLEPKFLLKCCEVSQTWNNIINAHENVWYNACKNLDWQLNKGEILKRNVSWKNMYLYLLRFSQKMMKSLAFTSKSYYGHESRITAVCYWNGKIVTGSDDKNIRIWDTVKEECIFTISTDCSISGIKLDDSIIVISSYMGCLKSFAYHEILQLLHCFEYHTGAVFSLDFHVELDLLISGAADNLVCIWSLSKGKLMKTLRNHTHWVVAVKLVQDEKSTDSYFILSMDRGEICVSQLLSKNGLENITCLQSINIGIPDYNFFTPGLECDGRFIYFIKQDPRKSGYTLFCCWDIHLNQLVKQQELNMTVKMLLAVGKKFACIITPWIDDGTPNFIIIRITDLKVVAQWHLPSSSPTTPGNSQIGTANINWLNGLSEGNHSGIILAAAYGLQNCLLYVLKWKDNLIFSDI